MAGRSEIDIFAQDNMDLALLANRGLARDLSDWSDDLPAEIMTNLVEACRFDGRLLFMPFRPNVQIVFYNTEAFREAGLSPPRTWDELLAVGRHFYEQDGCGRLLLKAAGGNPTATQLYEFILQAGGDPYALTDEGCLRAFRFLRELWQYASPESVRAKWDTSNEILARREAYLGQNWPFGVQVLIRDYRLPFIGTYSGWSGPAGQRHVIGGDVFGVPRNAPNPELARKFIRFMQSREVQKLLVSRLGWPAVRSDVYAQVADWQRPHFEAVAEALQNGVFRKNVSWWPAYVRQVTEAFREIVIEGQPADETLARRRRALEAEPGYECP